MNDMETLYEEFRKLREEVEGLTLEEVGAFRLREYKRRFEKLQGRDHELQSATRVNPNIDNEECRQILNLGDRMWEELGSTMIPIVELIDVKMGLGKQVASERIHIKELKEENLKNIKTLTNQLKRFKKLAEGITDPETRKIFDEKIASDEEIIQRLKDLDTRYEERMKELGAKLRVIALGGHLDELDEVRKDTEGLEPEEAERLADGVVPEDEDIPTEEETTDEHVHEESTAEEGIPEVTFDGLDPVTPLVDPTRTTDAEPAEEPVPDLTEAPSPADTADVEPAEEPIPVLGGSDGTPEGEPVETEEPVPAFPGEEPTEEEVPALPGEGTGTPEETSESTPEEAPEETPVRATVREPKTKIWGRIQKVLEAAKIFLLTAIAVHTGLIAGANTGEKVNTNTDTEVVEETETPEETQTPEETETPEETQSAEVTPGPQEEAPAETTPTTTPEVTPTPTPEVTPAPTPTVTVGENDVVLEQGESVYDATTGVEVGYTGEATRETETGRQAEKDRELDHLTETQVVVREEDMKPAPVETPLPRTGQEITEEQARQTMTQGEQQNLDTAVDEFDWDAFFSNGPTR